MELTTKNKKVYLVYPPISKEERYSSKIGAAGGDQIPLGIFYLASYLRENGFEVALTDGEAENLQTKDIVNKIRQFSPQFVAISSTTVAFHRAIELAKEIKHNYANIKIILGGPHITSNVTHALSYNCFDYGVLREGEITLTELLNTLYEGENISEINGIAFRNTQNEIIVTKPREYINNLDVLPFPAYDLIKDINLYTPPPSNYKDLPVVNIITSRGCPGLCTFCDNNVFGRKYRQRSAENIFQEIKYLYNNYKIKEIAFVDDTFLIAKKRLFKLFELLESEGIYLPWTCMARINDVNYELLQYLKAKGCWHISFGIESGDETILKIIKKNLSLEKVNQVINWCKILRIKTKGFFIIGHPGETIATIDKTITFACKLRIDDVVATINTPIPGTIQYAEIDKYGTADITDWSQYNYWRPVFVPKGLSKEILLKKHKEFYKRFYFRPRIIIRYFKSFFGRGGMRRFISIIKASEFIFGGKNINN
ncbi:MAG: B12-binding domain-containing radical SAM protein [Deltaproteobacteria bacterium]|nr:B12-binding domain-containing radical SAM protein [Deltaproteobacteria bacterium]